MTLASKQGTGASTQVERCIMYEACYVRRRSLSRRTLVPETVTVVVVAVLVDQDLTAPSQSPQVPV